MLPYLLPADKPIVLATLAMIRCYFLLVGSCGRQVNCFDRLGNEKNNRTMDGFGVGNGVEAEEIVDPVESESAGRDGDASAS